jgi:hypothetical protein
MNRRLIFVSAILGIAAIAGCTDTNAGRLSLAITSVRAGTPAASGSSLLAPFGAPNVTTAGDSTLIALGNDSIILRSVEVVVREVKLKRVEAPGCDAIVGNDDCEEFETGVFLVALPLGSTATETVVSINAPPGMYDELEFEIHKPESSDDAAFIAAHPSFIGIALRATGTYSQAGTRRDFVYTSELNARQELFLSPPLTVIDGSATNVTLRLDIARWFLNAPGTALVDPASANKGQPNESVVKDRIQASIDAFRDNDRDGHDDDNEHT